MCAKDSTEITRSDREAVLDAIKGVDAKKFIITHGTDTLIDTATFLRRRQAEESISGNTVILTGSMKPQLFVDSDASFNIGAAVGAIGILSAGVAVFKSGPVVPCQRAGRDIETGVCILSRQDPGVWRSTRSKVKHNVLLYKPYYNKIIFILSYLLHPSSRYFYLFFFAYYIKNNNSFDRLECLYD